MTPAEISNQLEELSRELDDRTREYDTLEANAVAAKRDYELAYARAYLDEGNTGPVEARTQRARMRTADERYTAELTAAKVRACKESIRTLHARLDVARTRASTVRTEMQMTGAIG